MTDSDLDDLNLRAAGLEITLRQLRIRAFEAARTGSLFDLLRYQAVLWNLQYAVNRHVRLLNPLVQSLPSSSGASTCNSPPNNTET